MIDSSAPMALRLQGVRAGYGETVVLEDIGFELPERGALALLGRIDGHVGILAMAGLPVVWLGSALGAALYARSPDERYRRVALWMLAATAVATAARVFWN